ncbi:hypothetical protein HMPREF9081_0598 [Centipeda periodontii DSM 2778]|uniref:Uncharacterized protein n=1 Tax=Centipeda periodontii DSM 2778 TaxID=888060 RepID=F5RK13_9FIRM|nr:hypothetical protein HMPREF9081_0598 [Centipeda periodontii DSM 2778]
MQIYAHTIPPLCPLSAGQVSYMITLETIRLNRVFFLHRVKKNFDFL